jgi:hypothetical protein
MQVALYAAIAFGLPFAASAQDPYRVAPDHYHLVFENQWVRATRVTYGPHETAPVHQHPPTPTTVYVYLTDGVAMWAMLFPALRRVDRLTAEG